MLTCVLDTNVYISAILFRGKPRQILESVLRGELRVFISEPIVEELRGVLRRPKFGFSVEAVQTIITEVLGFANFVQPSRQLDVVIEDPDDNRILECAIEAGAVYLITGDMHLLNLRNYRGVKVVNPDEFLEKVGRIKK
jgi:putative PIN family toxin of toxin-antitoxin system